MDDVYAQKLAKKILKLEDSKQEDYIRKSGFEFFGERYRMKLTMNILNKLKIIDFTVFLMAYVSCILAVVSLELNMKFEDFPNFDSNEDKYAIINFDPENSIVVILRITISILTLLIILGIILHHIIRFKYDKFRLVIPKNASIFSFDYLFFMIFEILLNLIHTPNGFNFKIYIPQLSQEGQFDVNIDIILTILLLFFRSYHFMKYFAFHSKWNNIYNEKICEASNVKFNFSFCLKSEFKENPFFLVSILLGISIFVFGYSLRCVEMFSMKYNSVNTFDMNWNDIWNGFWCVVITMTTVGFGDYYPRNILGKTIIVISCFLGTFLISMMVAALTYIIEFNNQEAVAYDKIKCSDNDREYGLKAVLLLQRSFRYIFHMKRLNSDLMLINDKPFRILKSNLFRDVKCAFEDFRKIKYKKIKQNFYSEIEKIIKKLNVNISNEMDKIKDEINIIPNIKRLLYDYNKNQENIKVKILELYKELEEITIFRDYFVKI